MVKTGQEEHNRDDDLLASDDPLLQYEDSTALRSSDQARSRSRESVALRYLFIALPLVGAIWAGLAWSSSFLTVRVHGEKCVSPSIRREWGSLPAEDQRAYLSAVSCLASRPSATIENGTIYDQFPWVHARAGLSSHGSALFFPWHRYFLHVFETQLRSSCGYKGAMVYWDWTLDWADLAASPVFSGTYGFGGDGDTNGSVTVGHGRCVADGPFSSLRPQFIDGVDVPHCLSRGFDVLSTTGPSLPAPLLRPDAIAEVFRATSYEDFCTRMESGPHDVIPLSIRGDFYMSTAPNDPLFYLHHAQLDRLWWLWQHQDHGKELWSYGGRQSSGSQRNASLEDAISMAGFAPEVEVRDVMRTDTGLLCYTY